MAPSSFVCLCLLLFVNYNNGDKDGKYAVIINNLLSRNLNDQHGDEAYVTQDEQSAKWIRPKRETLFDTTHLTEPINWTTNEHATPGWHEVSVSLPNGPSVHAQRSCNTNSPIVDNWLRTPFIDVKDAKRLYIKVTYTMAKCGKVLDPASLQRCKETFKLYYYQGSNHNAPPFNEYTYSLLDTVAADHLSQSPDDFIMNTETRSLSLTDTSPGIYFAFQDTGACVTLLTVQVYYKVCPMTTNNYAVFVQTATGKDMFSSVMVEGHCVENAEKVSSPVQYCMADGTWALPRGGCQCKVGFTGNGRNTCTA